MPEKATVRCSECQATKVIEIMPAQPLNFGPNKTEWCHYCQKLTTHQFVPVNPDAKIETARRSALEYSGGQIRDPQKGVLLTVELCRRGAPVGDTGWWEWRIWGPLFVDDLVRLGLRGFITKADGSQLYITTSMKQISSHGFTDFQEAVFSLT